MNGKLFIRSWLVGLMLAMGLPAVRSAQFDADLCVYGGTAGGVASAVQAARMGKSAIVIEPGRHLGGLSSGGLGATDIGNKAAIGGIAREFYQRVAKHYAQDSAWRFETRQEYFERRGGGRGPASDLNAKDATMWTFEPHVAESIFADLLKEKGIRVFFEQRIAEVKKEGARLVEFSTEKGDRFHGQMFVDATYEGDLMAKARVSFSVGRESNAQYGESLNGIRENTPKHQFTVPVDPYRTPGDPASGLLPFIQKIDFGNAGAGDSSVQAYNFRLCLTTNAANRLPIVPPLGYDPARYELLGRYFAALVAAGKKPRLEEFWNPIWMPNGKTDINNNGGFSTDFIGANYDYPNADYSTRESIWREHDHYTRGFLTFLATDTRVPENLRAEMRQWGPCKDEFVDSGGWSPQLYVREARRLIGDYVMSEQNCRGFMVPDDSVGLGAYNMDSHNCRRIVRDKRVENEGDVQVSVKPYPISYRSIVPKQAECENLLVPVCLSATHIAYGSIRMEPVFMILGQSAATAACLALQNKTSVQKVDYNQLERILVRDGQVLSWSPAR